ncbi:MAG: hypothetical protein LIP02_11170 [Bacteroidales bacterium]|nr:hypothetical protein [Bacteroidales bacterium]
MKILRIVMAAVLVFSCTAASAQKRGKEEKEAFVEKSAREASPHFQVFVFPQICDLQMLSTERVDFGTFSYPLSNDLSRMTNGELENDKARALHDACRVYNADIIIEPMYTSVVYDADQKTIHVGVTGYPAKYVKFRTLNDKDLEMIKVLYPMGVPDNRSDRHVLTVAEEGAK